MNTIRPREILPRPVWLSTLPTQHGGVAFAGGRTALTGKAVFCTHCGSVPLSPHEYELQMSRPNNTWFCPVCSYGVTWDDNHYEYWQDAFGLRGILLAMAEEKLSLADLPKVVLAIDLLFSASWNVPKQVEGENKTPKSPADSMLAMMTEALETEGGLPAPWNAGLNQSEVLAVIALSPMFTFVGNEHWPAWKDAIAKACGQAVATALEATEQPGLPEEVTGPRLLSLYIAAWRLLQAVHEYRSKLPAFGIWWLTVSEWIKRQATAGLIDAAGMQHWDKLAKAIRSAFESAGFPLPDAEPTEPQP